MIISTATDRLCSIPYSPAYQLIIAETLCYLLEAINFYGIGSLPNDVMQVSSIRRLIISSSSSILGMVRLGSPCTSAAQFVHIFCTLRARALHVFCTLRARASFMRIAFATRLTFSSTRACISSWL